jgi:hypothetical protein
MALIVQDPLAPTGAANSYLSLVDWQERATELGLPAPTEDKILTGMLYVDTSNFIGETVVAFQGTAWPRTGVNIYHAGELVEYDTEKVPQQVIDAVLYVAAEDNVYSTTQGGKRVLRKKIDVIETEYADDGINAVSFKRVSKADALLSKFTASSRPSQIVYAV